MNDSLIIVRYANAFFSLAVEKKLADKLKKDMQVILQVSFEGVEFISLLESPIIEPREKVEAFNALFSGRVHELTLDFLRLITANRRENYIPAICRNVIDLYRKAQGITPVVLTTSTEISEATQAMVTTLLKKELNTGIELQTKVKPGIIGGIILQLNDKQLDASVSGQLHKIKKELKRIDR